MGPAETTSLAHSEDFCHISYKLPGTLMSIHICQPSGPQPRGLNRQATCPALGVAVIQMDARDEPRGPADLRTFACACACACNRDLDVHQPSDFLPSCHHPTSWLDALIVRSYTNTTFTLSHSRLIRSFLLASLCRLHPTADLLVQLCFASALPHHASMTGK